MSKEDYFKYYIQGLDHYLIPKDIFDELYDEINCLQEKINKANKLTSFYKDELTDWKFMCIVDY